MRNFLSRLHAWSMFAIASAVLLSGCANVAFDNGVSRLDDKALVFGRILLDRDGETLAVSPFSVPVVIRNIASADEPKILARNFEKDGAFQWALPPGRYQVSLVLHNYSGGTVSYSFNLENAGRSYYFGDLILHGKKRFDSLGGANIRDVKPEFTDLFADAKADLFRRNPQLDANAVDRLRVRDMSDPRQRGSAYEEALHALSPCCPSLERIPFKKLVLSQRSVEKLGLGSPVFDFPEGRSRFAAWELPPLSPSQTIVLRSVATPSGMPGRFYVFSPAVMMLDENFNVLGDQHSGLFIPLPASIMPPRSASLTASISFSGRAAKARYLIVYTSRSIIEGSWRTSGPGFAPIAGGVLPTGIPVSVSMEPAISGEIEIEVQ